VKTRGTGVKGVVRCNYLQNKRTAAVTADPVQDLRDA
jgi:hypothetical protein